MPVPKPDACKGCPYYTRSKYMVPDEIHPGASVTLMFQNPGAEEEAQGRPLVGPTGQMMEREYFRLAGLDRSRVNLSNALRCRLDGKNDLPELTQTEPRLAVEHCTRAHFRVQPGTKLLVASGNYAAYALTGDFHAETWRGWVVPLIGTEAFGRHLTEPWVPRPGDLPVLVTLHLARLFRDPALTLPVMRDWSKIAAILAGRWPVAPPPFQTTPPDTWPDVVAFDTEFIDLGPGRTPKLTMFSLSDKNGQVWVCEGRRFYFPTFPPGIRVVTQQAIADIDFLHRFANGQQFELDDTMLKHSVLYSDLPHDLDFLGSIYSSMNRWKHLRTVDGAQDVYAGCDAWGTMEVDMGLEREFARDPQSRQVYLQYVRPLIPIIHKAQRLGLRVNPARVREVHALLSARAQDAQNRAAAAVGWPINLASNPQVGQHLYEIEGLARPRKRRKR